jgi:hypothetical protein
MYKIFNRYGSTVGKLAAVMGAMGLSAAMHEFCKKSKIHPGFLRRAVGELRVFHYYHCFALLILRPGVGVENRSYFFFL